MFRKLILASAVSLAMLPGVSWSLGLGGIRSQTALNEPFSGEIDLYDVKPDELDTVKAVLAPPAEFAKVGSDRPHFLTKLRFSSQVTAAGNAVIRVESQEPIREPYLDFLVEITWPKGRIVKGFTVLLDPPVTLSRTAPRVSPPRSVNRGPSYSAAASSPAAPRNATGYPLRYGPVRSGTGLWRVARAVAPSGATVQQTAMALYRSNQDAFIRGNINKLKLGAELEIPTPDELFALDSRAAEREFSRALRGGRVMATPITDISRARQAPARLEIAAAPAPAPVARQPEQAAATPQENGMGAEPEFGAIQRELLIVQESTESTRQEAEELRSRVRELETQLIDIKTLLELRNEQLAQLQSARPAQLDQTAAEVLDIPPDFTVTESEPTVESMPEPELVAELEPELTTEAEPELQPAQESEQITAEVPVDGGDTAVEPPPTVLEVQDEPKVVEAVAASQSSGPGTDTQRPDSVEVPSPPPADKSFLESLSATTLGTAVGIPALLALFGFWALRRRKKVKDDEPRLEGFTGEEASPAEIVASQERDAMSEQPESMPSPLVDSADASSLGSTLSSDFGDLDGDTEEAEILSEVDVYIAFGRYREAENLLNEEIKASPGRMDLRFKLAEVYHATSNAGAFDVLRTELREAGAEDIYPDQWQQLDRFSEELARAGAPAGKSSVVAFRSPSSRVPEGTETTQTLPGSLSQEPNTSEMTTEFELSDLVDGDSLLSEEPFVQRDASDTVSARGGERAEEGAAHGLVVEKADSGGMDSTLEEAERESVTKGGPSSVFDSRFDDLSDLDFHSDQELGAFLPPEPAVPPSLGDSAPAGDGGALDSTHEGAFSKDTTGEEDVFSSQWEMDSGLWDEVATKIDLARAYMEMEDPDAARVILEEVIAEGNEEQKGEAQEMLSRLK